MKKPQQVWVVLSYIPDEHGLDGVGLTVFNSEKAAEEFADFVREETDEDVEVWQQHVALDAKDSIDDLRSLLEDDEKEEEG